MGEPYRSKFIKGMNLSGHSFAHISAAGSSENNGWRAVGAGPMDFEGYVI
jgi:hypothetical protein